MTEFVHGVMFQAPTYEVFPVEISPPENTKVILKKLVSLQNPWEMMYIDGRIGTRLLPFHGPIDLAFFQQHHRFEVGEITEDEPLRLYLQPISTPAVLPLVSVTIVGEVSTWVPPPFDEDRRHQLEELSLSEYESWLRSRMDEDRVQMLLAPAQAFVRGYEPEL